MPTYWSVVADIVTEVISTVLLALVIGFAVTTLANVSTTVYLHRAAAHRALTLRAPVEHGFRFLVWVTTGIKPRQ